MFLEKRFKFIFFVNIFCVYLLNNQVKTTTNDKQKAYLIENEKFLNFHSAVEYCKNNSMSLFKVETFDEFEYLKSIIKARHGRLYPYWLGAYKINGVFKWISTGEDIKLFLWHAGEPNDKSGHEKCIHTWEDYFDWNDNDCERELPFICEVKE